VTALGDGFRFGPERERALTVRAVPGTFVVEPEWQYMQPLPSERQRGLEDATDLYSPGHFTLTLKGGAKAALVASADDEGPPEARRPSIEGSLEGRRAPATLAQETSMGPPRDDDELSLPAALREALRAFVVKRGDALTVIAGYPWFLDWGRDTLICLRGMIAAGMRDEAATILRVFARFEERGTLPNMIRGADASNRDTSDAPLWFFAACADALAARPAIDILDRDAGGRTVREVLFSIANAYRRGTPNGIRMDPDSGLIFSPSHFTWMDTNHPAGTPREGYPIEIQALWHGALRLLAALDPAGDWSALAGTVRASIVRRFAGPRAGGGTAAGADIGLSDCLHAAGYRPAAEAAADDHLRPNQLLAVTLGAVEDPALRRRIVTAAGELLVPGAIRSLADRPVAYALPVRRDGQLLNDQHHPYWGTYGGDEDTRRKPAYHNGTAWTWLFPSYVEALFLTHGAPAREAGLALLGSVVDLVQRGIVGQVPELADGDAPHAERGCGAQAWGASEFYRVLAFLGDTA
jgi:predicted glycogen debranching enzyme